MLRERIRTLETKELFPYQAEGVEALKSIMTREGGARAALLSDPPGAGKTSQAIALASALGIKDDILIICPASLRLNWDREFRMWSTIDDTLIIKCHADSDAAWGKWGAVITSYTLASNEPTLTALTERKWKYLILDESHYCKSPSSQTARSCLITIWNQCRYRLLITGTPIPNGRASEAWSTFSRLLPSVLGSWKDYCARYCIPYETNYGVAYRSKNLDELGRIARGTFMVRRKREDILGQLPEMVRCQVPIEVPELKVFEAQDGIDIGEIVRAVEAGIPLMSDALSTARRKLGELKAQGAYDYIVQVVLEEVQNCVVFVHHRAVYEALASSLMLAGVSFVSVTGKTSVDDRQKAVDTFQAGGARVFLASLTAANVGITLTASSTVVFVEFDWTPSVNEQAEGRVRRIGQKDIMRSIYLFVPDSLDEKILGVVRKKQREIGKVMQEV